jgi:hypothetical protein
MWRQGGFFACWRSSELQAGKIRVTAMTGVNHATILASARARSRRIARMLVRLGTRPPAEAVRIPVMAELAHAYLKTRAAHRRPSGGISRGCRNKRIRI